MDRVFSFLLWPKREARGPWKQERKKRGSITCPTDWANEANKMFIIWLCSLFRFWKSDPELEVRTATYRPGIDQSQHAESVSHIIKGGIFVIFQVVKSWGCVNQLLVSELVWRNWAIWEGKIYFSTSHKHKIETWNRGGKLYSTTVNSTA